MLHEGKAGEGGLVDNKKIGHTKISLSSFLVSCRALVSLLLLAVSLSLSLSLILLNVSLLLSLSLFSLSFQFTF